MRVKRSSAPAAGRADPPRGLFLQRLDESLELGVGNRAEVLFFRVGAGLDLGPEFPEGADALLLQTVELGAEIPIDLGVPGPVPARVAEHVLGEQILGVAAGAGA